MADSLEELVGVDIDGTWRLAEILGRGGMGAVFKAERIDSGHRVALKLLHPHSADDHARARFLREARLAARINHPHVVRILDFGRWGPERSRCFLAMELLDCVSLAWLLDAELPTPMICGLASQALAALAHVHAREVLHRDIKPENLLITRDSTGELVLKIADFGIAAAMTPDSATRLTADNVVLGTPSYMAPEQALGQTLAGPGLDLYPVGVLLYRMLCGRLPFTGPPMAMMLAKTRQEPFWPRDGRGTKVDPGLRQVVLKLLARQPEDRFAFAADARKALRPFSATPALSEGDWARLGGPLPESATQPVDSPMPTREAASAPFWGRQRDLDRIAALVAEAEGGAGRVLLLHGDAGVGKSTLLRHVSRQLAEEGRFFVLRYQSIANGGNFVEGIDRFLGTLGRPREDVEAAAREFMRRHQAEDELEVQRLTELLRPIGGGDPAERQQAAFALSVRTLRRIAQRRPLLLTMDDIALAGAVGAAYLEHFLFEVSFEPFPALIACTWRDSDANPPFLRALARSDRSEGRDRVTLQLGPLAQGEILQGLVESHGIDRSGAARIATRSGGNPLFARLLLDAGAHGQDTDVLPERLKGMLQASLDTALRDASEPKRSRRLLELLATLGTRVELDLLHRVPGFDDPADLEDTIDELVDAGLLAELGLGDSASLVFTHGLHREAVRETTTPRRQRRLHGQAASILDAWSRDGGPSVAARIARHHDAAGDVDAAREAWMRAVEEEAGRGDALTAVHCGVMALACLPDGDTRRDALSVELGRLRAETGDADGAEALLRPLIRGDDAAVSMAAGEVLAGVLENRADARDWTALLEELEPVAARGGPDERRAWQRCAAIWFNAMGRPIEAAKAARAALDGAPPGHETRLAAQRLTFACLVLGQPAEARSAAELAMAHAGDSPDHRARALRALGTVDLNAGRIESARALLGESLELVRTSGRSARVPLALMDCALVELRADDVDAARAGLREAARAARASGVGWVEHRAAFRELLCDLRQGRTEGVGQRVEALLPVGQKDALGQISRIRGPILAWLALREGRVDDALAALEPAEPFERSPALPEVAWLCEALAHAFAQLGRPEAARFDAVARSIWQRCGE